MNLTDLHHWPYGNLAQVTVYALDEIETLEKQILDYLGSVC